MRAQYQNNTAKHYSWLRRGISWSFRNIKFQNSINMITAITTSGYSVSYLKYGTTTSQTIVDFLKVLLGFIKRVDGVDGSKIGIILDNCQCHRTKKVKEFAQRSSLRLYFLPSYSPELAPVETYFSKLKCNVIKEEGNRSWNLKSKMGMDLAIKAIRNIGPDFIKSLWRHYFESLKKEIAQLSTM